MSHSDLVRAIAAERLPGSLLAMPDEPLGTHQWNMLLRNVGSERLVGLLSSAIASGRLPVTDGQRSEAADLEAAQATVTLRLDRALLEIADRFDTVGIPFRVLKGAALAYALYAEPELRVYGDVDVLVPSEHLDDALAELIRGGATRRFLEPRPGFLRRFGKGVSLRRADGVEVDVHRTLVAGPFGLSVDLHDLFSTSTTFTVGGRSLLGLGPVPRFLHGCYHAVLGSDPPRLLPLRDVAEMCLAGDVDLEDVLAAATSWRSTAIVATAVKRAWTELAIADSVPLSTWAASYVLSSREERQLTVYRHGSGRYPRQAVASLWSIPRFADRVAYARAMLLPSRAYLRERDRTYVQRVRRGFATLREVESDR